MARDRIVTAHDPDYPVRLRRAAKVPDTLFARSLGEIPDGDRVVAIVGSRAASGHAMASARQVAEELAAKGTVVVSGGAIGIDSAAHRGALDGGGKTVVVLATGLDAPYPARNRPLFADVVAGGGALVSPYPAGSPPRRYHFVERNRIIAAMADVVIVGCAQLGSGALHTAAFAVEYGKIVAAIPGTPGCEALIAQGAAVVESAADVALALAGNPRRPDVQLPIAGSEQRTVLDVLDGERALGADLIVERSGLAARDVQRALIGLELEGLALALPGGQFLRSALAAELS